jgi:FAD/FMN-containing dehydrogenase
MHTRSAAELKSLYPRYADFARVRAELDPKRVMLNAHLAAMFPDGGP